MIPRRIHQSVQEALNRQAAVALIGPRQVGKTTLALQIAKDRETLYLDLEAKEDRFKLENPSVFLGSYQDRLVILDEIHRMPELFQTLRGLIDQGRQEGKRTGRFLILGSASIDLLRQNDLHPDHSFLVYPGCDRCQIGPGLEAIGVRELAAMLTAL
ncbi:MAG: AAA family ATPase [Candidatus Melainabacteria bacterium]|nr:AAA family ATPase [Candidatus Melainabacteria bacterium]